MFISIKSDFKKLQFAKYKNKNIYKILKNINLNLYLLKFKDNFLEKKVLILYYYIIIFFVLINKKYNNNITSFLIDKNKKKKFFCLKIKYKISTNYSIYKKMLKNKFKNNLLESKIIIIKTYRNYFLNFVNSKYSYSLTTGRFILKTKYTRRDKIDRFRFRRAFDYFIKSILRKLKKKNSKFILSLILELRGNFRFFQKRSFLYKLSKRRYKKYIKITKLYHNAYKPHNGCRPKKLRRI